ncbi:MAG: hypothetical protein IJH79_05845 [Lentisphaeria bacterium]|nr:hypothetical protein [Lentisphaeria bacterium]
MRHFLTVPAWGLLAAGLSAGEIWWNEDGKALNSSSKYSTSAWFGQRKMPVIKARSEGGFTLGSNCTKYLTVKPGMWLTFELDAVRRTGKPSAYHAWSISYPKLGKLAGNVSNIPTGLYTIHLADAGQKMTKAAQFYVYNGELDFRYMRLESAPENSLEVIVPEGRDSLKAGDKFRVELRLKDPCEDVSCKFLHEYGRGPVPLAVNGTDSIDLKAVDDSGKFWAAEVEIKAVKSPRRILKRAAMVKVTVLGGKLDKPVFTSFPVPVRQNPEPAK